MGERGTFKVGDITLHNVHHPESCEGRGCWIHHPSDHPMVDWPLHWRMDRALAERICEHGVGHPDPDHIAWLRDRVGDEYADAQAVHGCDGCCGGAYMADEPDGS